MNARLLIVLLALTSLFAGVTVMADNAVPGGGTTTPTPTPPNVSPVTPTIENIMEDIPSTGDATFDGAKDRVAVMHDQLIEKAAGMPAGGQQRALLHNLREMETELNTMKGATVDATIQTALDARIRNVQRAQEIVVAVVAGIEQADTVGARSRLLNSLSSMARRQGMAYNPPTGSRTAVAGDLISFTSLELSTTYSSFHDGAALGGGHDKEGTMTLNGLIGENTEFSLSASRSAYKLGGPLDLDRSSDTLELFVGHYMTERFSIGAFVNFSMIDLEDNPVDLGGIATTTFADTYDRWGAGIMASGSMAVGTFDLGLTSTLASVNKEAFDAIFDNESTLWATMVDLQKNWTDQISTTVYGSYFTLIDNEDEGVDAYFWVVGADISYAPADWVSFSLGYEKTLALTEFRDNRVNASISLIW